MTPKERREMLLDFAMLHGVVTAAWVMHLYEGLTAHSAAKDLQTLKNQGLLRRFKDASRRPWYTPTAKLCEQRKVHRSLGRSGGPVSIARRVGVASYCHRYALTRLTAAQFASTFPELSSKKVAPFYALDRSAEPHLLVWLEADCNPDGDVRRVVKKVQRIFRVRARHSAAFAAWIEARQFAVVIVTPSEGRRLRLDAAFARAKWKPPGPVHLEVVEELQDILFRETKPWQTSKRSSTGPTSSGAGETGSSNGSASSDGSCVSSTD